MRSLVSLLIVALAVAACGSASWPASQDPSPSQVGTAASAPHGPTPSPTPAPTASPSPTPTVTQPPRPTPTSSPVVVAAPLTGLPVPPAVASRPVFAVMIDDHADARPQTGLASADVVWQAPAEGGIPRFMALFSSQDPPVIGPVRSARLYFVAWATEQRAVYAHAGGSPGALAELSTNGAGAHVWNIEGLDYVGGPFYRTSDRWAPHNLYTGSRELAALATSLGYAPEPARTAYAFAPAGPTSRHGPSFRILFSYGGTQVGYTFDPATRTYPRAENDVPTTDAATGDPVAPTNVVILSVAFSPLNDGSGHGRLDAGLVGEGPALVFRAGELIRGRWRKTAFEARTELLLPASNGPDTAIPLVPGQTFIQVVPAGTPISVDDAGAAPVATPMPVPVDPPVAPE